MDAGWETSSARVASSLKIDESVNFCQTLSSGIRLLFLLLLVVSITYDSWEVGTSSEVVVVADICSFFDVSDSRARACTQLGCSP